MHEFSLGYRNRKYVLHFCKLLCVADSSSLTCTVNGSVEHYTKRFDLPLPFEFCSLARGWVSEIHQELIIIVFFIKAIYSYNCASHLNLYKYNQVLSDPFCWSDWNINLQQIFDTQNVTAARCHVNRIYRCLQTGQVL